MNIIICGEYCCIFIIDVDVAVVVAGVVGDSVDVGAVNIVVGEIVGIAVDVVDGVGVYVVDGIVDVIDGVAVGKVVGAVDTGIGVVADTVLVFSACKLAVFFSFDRGFVSLATTVTSNVAHPTVCATGVTTLLWADANPMVTTAPETLLAF